ncbi:MAG: hypothetical protein J6K03_01300 [Oscillospiraceae bacterium]|nr:hypothetical protein [Oscillospiraceae bacterium]
MSKPRYNWWPFVLNIIRDYPAKRAALKELHEQRITVNISGMPMGGGASRTIENVALRQLPRQEQKEYDAVHEAIRQTKILPDGKLRLDVVKLTLWGYSYSIAGAAQALNISDRTARRYRWQFVLLVGHTYGFLSADEYNSHLSKDMGNEITDSQSQKSVI